MLSVRKLLVINPNTSASISALIDSHARTFAGPQVAVQTVTARFGAPYIGCESSYAVAGHAALDAWATARQAGTAFDAVLLGCFGDPGLFALRDVCGVPVTGLAEAAFVQAARHGPFAIVTGGTRWKPMLERLAQSLGVGHQLAGIQTVVQSGAELARDPIAAQQILAGCCEDAARRFDAKSIILGGAGLAGMATNIQPQLGLPLIDSVSAGVHHLLSLPAAPAHEFRPFDFEWSGVSPELKSTGANAP